MTSTGGQIKALLDGVDGLGQVYRLGYVPEGAPLPYATFLDPIGQSPSLSGDARTLAWRVLIQVDLWQDEDNLDPDLPRVVAEALDGVRIEAGRVRVQDMNIIPEPDPDEKTVHHAMTVSVASVR